MAVRSFTWFGLALPVAPAVVLAGVPTLGYFPAIWPLFYLG